MLLAGPAETRTNAYHCSYPIILVAFIYVYCNGWIKMHTVCRIMMIHQFRPPYPICARLPAVGQA